MDGVNFSKVIIIYIGNYYLQKEIIIYIGNLQ
jgi:hypothetical protein